MDSKPEDFYGQPVVLGAGERVSITLNAVLYEALLHFGKDALQEGEQENLSFEDSLAFLVDQVIDDRIRGIA
jgi:hypothetical protein